MKKIFLVLLSFTLIFALASCGDRDTKEEKPLILFVTDAGGLGDQSYNDMIWRGCERASDDGDMDIRCLESESVEEYRENLMTAVDAQPTLIITAGTEFDSMVQEVLKDHPDQRFLCVDGKESADNRTNLVANDQEGGFLAGFIAATETQSGTIGYIGSPGEEDKAKFGFLAGAYQANPQVEVVSASVEAVEDEQQGQSLATELHSQGADILFQGQGKFAMGIIEAAKEEDFMVIGSVKDQSGLDSNHILCSVKKKIPTMVKEEIERAIKGKTQEEMVVLSLEDEGIVITDRAGNLSASTEEKTDQWKKDIIKGELSVPYDSKSYEEFLNQSQ